MMLEGEYGKRCITKKDRISECGETSNDGDD